MRAAPGQQDDRLEEARLACRVGPPDQLRAGFEHGVERRVAAQVADGDAPQDRGVGNRRRAGVRAVRRGGGRVARAVVRQEVVRTGITTWT